MQSYYQGPVMYSPHSVLLKRRKRLVGNICQHQVNEWFQLAYDDRKKYFRSTCFNQSQSFYFIINRRFPPKHDIDIFAEQARFLLPGEDFGITSPFEAAVIAASKTGDTPGLPLYLATYIRLLHTPPPW